MAELKILALGPPEARLNGKNYGIPRKTIRALLFYLASCEGMVTRDELASLFWTEQPEQYARRRLSDNLSRLRNALPNPSLILVDANLVGLDFKRVYVDQYIFHTLLGQIGRIPKLLPSYEPFSEPIYQRLQQAAALWRSPRYLAGARFPNTPGIDDWLACKSREMERKYLRVLEGLTFHTYAIGDWEQSLNYITTALELDPLNEELHLHAMQNWLKSGRSDEALRHYEHTRELFQDELNTSPGHQLTNLYQQIRSISKLETHAPTQSKWRINLTLRTPFVGRVDILEGMRRAGHRGGGIFIYGESGQGKTRLIQEFIGQIHPKPLVLLSNCYPAESNLPYQPIIELLRNYVLPDEWLALPVNWTRQLKLLLPELAMMRTNLRQQPVTDEGRIVSPDQGRGHLLEAIRQVFLQISHQRRLVFCLDDAQWSDEATLTTLAYLLERPPFNHQALIIVAIRSDESNPHLEGLVASLSQQSHVDTFFLTRFNQQEIAEISNHVLGYYPSEKLVQQLGKETGGNPFFILESLRALLVNDHPTNVEQLDSLPIAENAQSLIHSRLDRLTPTARRVLQTAAIIGREFDAEFLIEACNLSSKETAAAFDELEQKHLLERAEKSLHELQHRLQYRFIHDKIRELLLQQINPIQARAIHEQVADALHYRLPISEQAAVLAHHYQLAGNFSKAFDFWVQAGRHAHHLFSSTEAELSFSQAAQLISRTANLSNEQIRNLYAEWTEMKYETENADQLQRLSQELLKFGQDRNSSLLIGTALGRLSDVAMVTNQFEEGLAFANQAIAYLENSENRIEIIEAYIRRGVFLYMLNRIGDAIQALRQTLSIIVDTHSIEYLSARANAHYQLSVVYTLSGQPKRGQDHALLSLADFSTINRPHGQVTAYSALALARYFMGEYGQARRDCKLATELAQRVHAWRMLGYLHGYRAMIELASGSLDTALEYAQKTLEIGERFGHHEIAAGGYRIIGDIYGWLRDPWKSSGYYQRALYASGNKFMAVDHLFRLGFALFQIGQMEAGKKNLCEALETSQEQGFGIVQIQVELCLLHVDQFQEHWQEVETRALYILDKAKQHRINSARLSAMSVLGEIALQRRDYTEAIALLNDVIEQAPKLPHPWLELRALMVLERALIKSGQPDPYPNRRMAQLLQQLEQNAKSELIRQPFKVFQRQFNLQGMSPEL